jgi:UDPglucose 6-dehydrogenase
MKTIGIVGLGFVGTAVFEGMKHAFNIIGYDKVKGVACWKDGMNVGVHSGLSGIEYLIKWVDGPIFVCVPTPMNSDGSCNTSIVEGVIKELSEELTKQGRDGMTVAIKSTVPPGTTLRLNHIFNNVYIVFNPEFLTERASVNDFKNQDRIIIGGPHEGTSYLKQVYDTSYPNVPVTKTSSTIAEMVKYMTNCFLAVKVSFANEVKQLCDKLDTDYDKVVEYASKDKRLGQSHWSVPGPDGRDGWGGSCFPKDLNALMSLCDSLRVECNTLKGAWATNLKVRPDKDWEQLKGRAVTDPSES